MRALYPEWVKTIKVKDKMKKVFCIVGVWLFLFGQNYHSFASERPVDKEAPRLSSKQGTGKLFPPKSKFLEVAGRDAYLAMPAGGKEGSKTPWLWCCPSDYKLPGQLEQFTKELKQHNPIDRLAPLAEAKVPIYHNTGDVDTLVPAKDNTLIVEERYKALGGEITVTVFEGQGHNYWTGFFEDKAMAYTTKQGVIL